MRSGKSCLCFERRRGQAEWLTALLERGIVNVLATDEHKNTALHCSARYGHDACLKLLLEAGADITAKGACGDTAKDLAPAHAGLVFAFHARVKDVTSILCR